MEYWKMLEEENKEEIIIAEVIRILIRE